MQRLSSLEDVERLYAERGALSYGEDVTQTEHALQCAVLAEAEGAAPDLILAALLHDIGHLFETEADAVRSDDRHEVAGAQALKPLFGEAVRAPIALHVRAKRYLCFKERGYLQALSAASTASLARQGGPFNATEAAAFERLAHASDALALRRFDDLGKSSEPCGRSFSDFVPLMRALTIGASE
jgi:phosphonate degradation associated HDIG domain protein